jgi:hypothetical protein
MANFGFIVLRTDWAVGLALTPLNRCGNYMNQSFNMWLFYIFFPTECMYVLE